VSQSSPFENLYQEELYALSPKVLVILSKNWEHVSEEDQLLLAKILGSVKLNLASVQILTLQAFDLDGLQVYGPTQIIAFGSVLKSSSKYEQLLTLHGTSVIQADALHKLDEIKKKSLWNALKMMFNQ
jgi:hypothetical protein